MKGKTMYATYDLNRTYTIQYIDENTGEEKITDLREYMQNANNEDCLYQLLKHLIIEHNKRCESFDKIFLLYENNKQ